MTPTNELRFVDRGTGKTTYMDEFGYCHKETRRILQQKWFGTSNRPNTGCDMPIWEWRDVPCVKEEP